MVQVHPGREIGILITIAAAADRQAFLLWYRMALISMTKIILPGICNLSTMGLNFSRDF